MSVMRGIISSGRGVQSTLPGAASPVRPFAGPSYVTRDSVSRGWRELAEALAEIPPGKLTTCYGATGGSDNQTSGASFRIIANTGDWETVVGTNTPGQLGNPDDPHYRDLFPLWANDRYFPVAYAKSHVEAIAESRDVLTPASDAVQAGRPTSAVGGTQRP